MSGIYFVTFIILMTIDWILKTTDSTRNGIHWTMAEQHDNLDFANDIVLLFHM